MVDTYIEYLCWLLLQKRYVLAKLRDAMKCLSQGCENNLQVKVCYWVNLIQSVSVHFLVK